MGKQPVKLKAVVYALSPFQQKIMPGLWKDLPGKIHHKVSENWISATLLLGPLIGTYSVGVGKDMVYVRAAFPGEGEVRTQILSSVRHLSGDQRINEVLFVTCLGRTAISISV
uniref:Cytochrome b-c1 complex subunit 8 n=1 Tax=Solanum lycopersicum TaxID=4081 RepID=A0A3Q7H4G3_SOLLC